MQMIFNQYKMPIVKIFQRNIENVVKNITS